MRTRLITLITVFTLTTFGASSASAVEDLATRTSTVSAVTIAATPHTFSSSPWEIELTFTTHSGALNDDVEKSSTLVTDSGKTISPIRWEGDAAGGHHRKGVLQFKSVSPRPASIELRMVRQGEAQPRTFKWQVKVN